MKNRVLALALIAALMLSGVIGCQNFGDGTKTTEASIVNQNTDSETSEADESETETSEESSEASYLGTDQTEFTTQDFSNFFEDNGFLSGITALDCLTLPDFASVKIAREDVEPDDETVESSLTSIANAFRVINTERAVEDGDPVNIDFAGSVDGVAFDGGTAEGYETTAGSEDFVDDFLKKIIGYKPGDNFDITVTFPDTYDLNEELAGKEAVFNVTINYVYDIPELTDEWIAEHKDNLTTYLDHEVGSAKELYDYVYDNLLKSAVFDKARSEIVNNWYVDEMPDEAFAASLNMTRASLYVNYGMTLNDYADILGYDDETIGTLVFQDAKLLLLYQGIAEQEGWNVTDADYRVITGTDENDDFIETYGRGYLSQYVLSIWAQDYIAENVTVE